MSGVWSLQLLINDYIMNFPSIIKSCGSEHYPGQLKTLSKFWLICSQSSILNVWQLHWHFRAAKICECLYFGIMTMKQLFFLFFFLTLDIVKIETSYVSRFFFIVHTCLHTYILEKTVCTHKLFYTNIQACTYIST